MSLQKTEAILLRRQEVRETSLMLVAFSRQLGKVQGLVKGVRGARAALCADAEIARGARRWNDANVLCLALSRTAADELSAIFDAWFAPEPVDDSEGANIERLTQIEGEGISSQS